MKCNPAGLAIIKNYEKCVLTAYPDPGSELGKKCAAMGMRMVSYTAIDNWRDKSGHPWTIGWGHTGPEVGPFLAWTQDYADEVLEKDLGKFEQEVGYKLRHYQVTSNQFSALVSFAYNLGSDDAFNLIDAITKATPNNTDQRWRLKKLDPELAKAQFPRYNRDQTRKPVRGLIKRRSEELALFLRE